MALPQPEKPVSEHCLPSKLVQLQRRPSSRLLRQQGLSPEQRAVRRGVYQCSLTVQQITEAVGLNFKVTRWVLLQLCMLKLNPASAVTRRAREEMKSDALWTLAGPGMLLIRNQKVTVFILGNLCISWCNMKHSWAAFLTTEAKYIATSFAGQEAQWLRRLLEYSVYNNTIVNG